MNILDWSISLNLFHIEISDILKVLPYWKHIQKITNNFSLRCWKIYLLFKKEILCRWMQFYLKTENFYCLWYRFPSFKWPRTQATKFCTNFLPSDFQFQSVIENWILELQFVLGFSLNTNLTKLFLLSLQSISRNKMNFKRFSKRAQSDPWISDRIRKYFFCRRFTVGSNNILLGTSVIFQFHIII